MQNYFSVSARDNSDGPENENMKFSRQCARERIKIFRGNGIDRILKIGSTWQLNLCFQNDKVYFCLTSYRLCRETIRFIYCT